MSKSQKINNKKSYALLCFIIIILAFILAVVITVLITKYIKSSSSNNKHSSSASDNIGISNLYSSQELADLAQEYKNSSLEHQEIVRENILTYFENLEQQGIVNDVLYKNENIYFVSEGLECIYSLQIEDDSFAASSSKGIFSEASVSNSKPGKNVLIVHGFTNSESDNDYTNAYKDVADIYRDSGWNVTDEYDVGVTRFAEQLSGYDCIYINAHGDLDKNGDPFIVSSEKFNKKMLNDVYNQKYNITGLLVYGSVNNGDAVYGIGHDFIWNSNNKLGDNIFVHICCCYGYYNDILVDSFVHIGADAVIGYSERAGTKFDSNYVKNMASNIIDNASIKSAFNIAVSNYGKINTRSPQNEEIKLWGDTDGNLIVVIDKDNPSKEDEENSLTDAEKYSQIVVDNEDVWLNPLNEMHISEYENCSCWFEDLDFDGELEFIVGGFNMGVQCGVNYNIYKFNNDKMEKQIDGAIYKTYGNKGSNLPSMTLPLIITAPNPGFGYHCCDIISIKGKNLYLFPSTDASVGSGYGILELDEIKDGVIYYSSLGSFNDYPEFRCKDGLGSDIIADSLLTSLDNYFDNATNYWSSIGNIPCTYINKHLDSQWYKNAAGSESGLNDTSSSYVSGCYDYLSRDEKLKALIKSYNAYHLNEIGSSSQLYNRFRQDLIKHKSNSSEGNNDPDADTIYQMPRRKD